MIDVIESLLAGDSPYPAAFARAKNFWGGFFSTHAADSEPDLQKAIEAQQIKFQWAMEEAGLIPPFAKAIMAITCVGSLYEDGFADRSLAERVVRVMSSSKSLSIGIPSSAEEVGRLYDL
ncbi:hypothetical protein GOZ78_23490 [Agrobacterium vitis]|uniref:hypothetical protein n=1 Tax=Agrobacterium vitis TaxID=373 RepID=UPI0012E8BB85|nr:hypothetical protein [Agrobacterium vitis]MVA12971.1 hypothetical protein [Agrobacterium vitis]